MDAARRLRTDKRSSASMSERELAQDPADQPHMPQMIFVRMHAAFGCEDMKGGQSPLAGDTIMVG